MKTYTEESSRLRRIINEQNKMKFEEQQQKGQALDAQLGYQSDLIENLKENNAEMKATIRVLEEQNVHLQA